MSIRGPSPAPPGAPRMRAYLRWRPLSRPAGHAVHYGEDGGVIVLRLSECPLAGESSASGYIIPLMSGIPPPAFLSGISATIASVVRMFLAIEAAFCSADRVTIAGSMTPAATRSTISPVMAFNRSEEDTSELQSLTN